MELSGQHIILIGGVLCCITGFLHGVIHILFRKNTRKYFLVVSAWWLIFWFSVPLARMAARYVYWSLPPIILAYKWFIVLASGGIAICLLFLFVYSIKSEFLVFQKILNVLTGVVLILLGIQGICSLQSSCFARQQTMPSANGTQNKKLPNIYHIILDAYTNDVVLKHLYQYDNSHFCKTLTDFGFVYIQNSYANYPITSWSVSSMLNLDYHYDKNGRFLPYILTHNDMMEKKLRMDNIVWPLLKKEGYEMHLLSQPNIYHLPAIIQNNFNPTTALFFITCITVINKTILTYFSTDLFLDKIYQQHLRGIKQILSQLTESPKQYELFNHYFFAHILSPHEPPIFDENGDLSQEREFEGFLVKKQQNSVEDETLQYKLKRRYVNQIRAINNLVIETIKNILIQYPEDHQPIIILHGDHGARVMFNTLSEWEQKVTNNELTDNMKAFFGNLFALYLPESWRQEAQSLQFINLYRFVFNHLLGTNYDYLSSWHFIDKLKIPHACFVDD